MQTSVDISLSVYLHVCAYMWYHGIHIHALVNKNLHVTLNYACQATCCVPLQLSVFTSAAKQHHRHIAGCLLVGVAGNLGMKTFRYN